MLINDGRNPDRVREVFVQFQKKYFQNTQPTLGDVLCLNRVQLRGQNAFTQEQHFSKYCIFYFTELSYSQKTYKFFIMFQVDLQNHWSHVLHEHYITNAQVSDLNFLRASAQVKHIIKCNTCFKACVKTYKCTSST